MCSLIPFWFPLSICFASLLFFSFVSGFLFESPRLGLATIVAWVVHAAQPVCSFVSDMLFQQSGNHFLERGVEGTKERKQE